MEEFKKEKMFEDGLEEFMDSRCAYDCNYVLERIFRSHAFTLKNNNTHTSHRAVVQSLTDEYKATERPDYASYVPQQ